MCTIVDGTRVEILQETKPLPEWVNALLLRVSVSAWIGVVDQKRQPRKVDSYTLGLLRGSLTHAQYGRATRWLRAVVAR